jgi:hypothetical protein
LKNLKEQSLERAVKEAEEIQWKIKRIKSEIEELLNRQEAALRVANCELGNDQYLFNREKLQELFHLETLDALEYIDISIYWYSGGDGMSWDAEITVLLKDGRKLYVDRESDSNSEWLDELTENFSGDRHTHGWYISSLIDPELFDAGISVMFNDCEVKPDLPDETYYIEEG